VRKPTLYKEDHVSGSDWEQEGQGGGMGGESGGGMGGESGGGMGGESGGGMGGESGGGMGGGMDDDDLGGSSA
jgi:hypothetical protein